MSSNDNILLKALHMPQWVLSPPPPQFASMIDQSWYYKTPDDYYLALVFTSKLAGNDGRAMGVYHVVGEPKARNQKFPTAQEAMETIQRICSENQIHVRQWL